MNPELFDSEYRKSIDAFLATKRCMAPAEVQGWFIYKTSDTPIGMAKSQRYVLSTEIVELIQIKTISRTNSYPLHFGINYASMWSVIPDVIFGFRHFEFTESLCHSCDMYVRENKHIWAIPNKCSLCHTCYTNGAFVCNFPCRITTPLCRQDYVMYDVYCFNALDWVQFAYDRNAEFYVNCNPQSVTFGNVAMFSYNTQWNSFIMIGDIHTFLKYITEWLQFTIKVDIQSDTEEYLNSMYYMTLYQNYVLSKYSLTFGGLLTAQKILDNQDKITDTNHHREIIGGIMTDLDTITLGLNHDNATFSAWIENQEGFIKN